MIKITNLSKTYDGNVQALQDISLNIGPGMFGLIGPNGAGKTTFMRILAGLIEPSSGSASILEHDVTTSQGKLAIKAKLGYLPQELGLYPNLTATEFVDYMARLKGIGDKQIRRQQVATVLEHVHLTKVADRRLSTFSGGMKRRVGIAQALLGQPKLIIVDEPTVGLDPEERVRLRNLLSDLASRCTVILSTHIIEDISQSCRALAVISQGCLLFQGSPSELIAQARGNVWIVETDGSSPVGDIAIVSSIQLANGTQYRVLGTPNTQATTAIPTLEDGYLWLIRQTTQ